MVQLGLDVLEALRFKITTYVEASKVLYREVVNSQYDSQKPNDKI